MKLARYGIAIRTLVAAQRLRCGALPRHVYHMIHLPLTDSDLFLNENLKSDIERAIAAHEQKTIKLPPLERGAAADRFI
jgi:hypothetical protein